MAIHTTPSVVAAAEGKPVGRPSAPIQLHHVAYVTGDTAATVDFYTRVMGMEFVAAVLDDALPSTKEPVPYFHSFFKMGSGETMAFFEAPDLPAPSPDSHPAYRTFRHLALGVASPAEVDAWKEWLVANGIDVIGPVDHGIIYSLYFFDPSGVRLELTVDLDPQWRANHEGASSSLEEWNELKSHAAATNTDVAAALDDLARVRSHRRSLSE